MKHRAFIYWLNIILIGESCGAIQVPHPVNPVSRPKKNERDDRISDSYSLLVLTTLREAIRE